MTPSVDKISFCQFDADVIMDKRYSSLTCVSVCLSSQMYVNLLVRSAYRILLALNCVKLQVWKIDSLSGITGCGCTNIFTQFIHHVSWQTGLVLVSMLTESYSCAIKLLARQVHRRNNHRDRGDWSPQLLGWGPAMYQSPNFLAIVFKKQEISQQVVTRVFKNFPGVIPPDPNSRRATLCCIQHPAQPLAGRPVLGLANLGPP